MVTRMSVYNGLPIHIETTLTQYANYINEFPERYDSRPLVKKFSDFASITDQLLPQFEEVLKDRKSPHFDDAAYFLGWLLYHRGNVDRALSKYELAISLLPRVGVQDDSSTGEYSYEAISVDFR